MIGYIGIETTRRDGSVTFRFVEVESRSKVKSAWQFAREQARRFDAKADVASTRLVAVSAETRKKSRELKVLPSVDEWD
jgi:hypothetical protein